MQNRYVSTSFWDDEWVQTLNLTEKGLYLYLLTNTLTNIAGVYKISLRRIVFDTGLSDSDVERIMGKFEDAGKAYRNGEYVVIPSWPKHQSLQSPKVSKGIQRILKDLPSEMIEFLSNIGYRYPLDSFASSKHQHSNDGGGDVEMTEPGDNQHQNGFSEEQKLFIRLWQETKDDDGMCLFPVTATIERPQDWKRFWEETPPTCEQIETAFRNFADGINSGAIDRRYIPATPDRFALKGGITRYKTPVVKNKKNGKDNGFPDDRISL